MKQADELDFTIAENAGGIVGYFRPDSRSQYFKGHFPGYPVVPGVLLLEVCLRMLAKAMGIPRESLKIRSFKKMSFLKPVYPDECVEITLQMEGAGNRFTGLSNGEVVFRVTACM